MDLIVRGEKEMKDRPREEKRVRPVRRRYIYLVRGIARPI